MTAAGLEARMLVRQPDGFVLDVELVVPPGETAALLGPNGAGKSTAVAALAGLRAVDEGRIVLDGRVLDDATADVHVSPAERRVGVVFQGQALFPHLSVRDNVAFGLVSAGMPRREARRRALEWLERLDLLGFADRRPEALSGGQAQQVALARVLVTEPAMLVLDEPLSALDVATRDEVRRLLVTHLEEFPGPRLVITHDPTEAFLLADRLHVVEDGRITQTGTGDEVRRHPRTPWAADLVGVNLLAGDARDGLVDVAGHLLVVAGDVADGETLVAIHPRAVALHLEQPGGSPRNAWPTHVVRVESLGDRARVELASPAGLLAEVTPATVAELGLAPGRDVWASVKATQVTTP